MSSPVMRNAEWTQPLITSDVSRDHLVTEDTAQLASARDKEVENLEKFLIFLTKHFNCYQKSLPAPPRILNLGRAGCPESRAFN